MKGLVNEDGKVLLRNGKVATTDSAACCCGGTGNAIQYTYTPDTYPYFFPKVLNLVVESDWVTI